MPPHTLLPLAALAATLACARPSPPAAPSDLARTNAALADFWLSYSSALQRGDAAATAAFFLEDATAMAPGAPTMRGRREIEGRLGEWLAGRSVAAFHVASEDVLPLGPHAFQTGTYHEMYTPTGRPPVEETGRFTALFSRDTTGAWRIDRLISLPDPAP